MLSAVSQITSVVASEASGEGSCAVLPKGCVQRNPPVYSGTALDRARPRRNPPVYRKRAPGIPAGRKGTYGLIPEVAKRAPEIPGGWNDSSELIPEVGKAPTGCPRRLAKAATEPLVFQETRAKFIEFVSTVASTYPSQFST